MTKKELARQREREGKFSKQTGQQIRRSGCEKSMEHSKTCKREGRRSSSCKLRYGSGPLSLAMGALKGLRKHKSSVLCFRKSTGNAISFQGLWPTVKAMHLLASAHLLCTHLCLLNRKERTHVSTKQCVFSISHLNYFVCGMQVIQCTDVGAKAMKWKSDRQVQTSILLLSQNGPVT